MVSQNNTERTKISPRKKKHCIKNSRAKRVLNDKTKDYDHASKYITKMSAKEKRMLIDIILRS